MLQLDYVYGCSPVKQPASDYAPVFVLAAVDGDATELQDPDAYKIELA